MLPPTQVVRPAARSISPTSVVVVVLPLEPVMPMIGAGQSRVKRRTSLLNGRPR